MKAKRLPKAPKAPKGTSAASLNAFKQRVDAWSKKVAEVKKHNSAIEQRKKQKEALKARIAKLKSK